MKTPQSERGAALLAVLAMVLLLAGFTSLGLQRLKASTSDISDAAARAEAQYLAEAGTSAALSIVGPLKARTQRQPRQFLVPIVLDMPQGRITLRFSEGGACFNFNALGADPPPDGQEPPSPRAFPDDLSRFLSSAGIPLAEADSIAHATARRLSSGVMWADASEWLATPGVTADHWNLARNLLCALPDRDMPSFSVNMLTPDKAPLLVALGLEPDEARRILASRPAQGWETSNQFWEQGSPAGIPGIAGAESLGVSTRWVNVILVVETPRGRLERELLIDSIRQPARLVASQWTRTNLAA